ncbi:7608_t:CDS:1, partial [Gigaspora rosea]
EIIDSYLNRDIAPLERIRMVMTGYFFIQLWCTHIEILSQKYPNFILLKQNFLANQTFAIFTSLCELLVLLVKAHCEYYPQIPLLPWFHGSEPVEHFFGIACQLNSDFDFLI